MKNKIKSMFIILLIFTLFNCDNIFGELNNPADQDSESYQGYKSVLDFTDIVLYPELDKITTDTMPKLTWDEVLGSTGYEIEINSTEDFTGSVIVSDSSLIINSYTAEEIFPEGIYYWRIKQKDENEDWSLWSSTYNFTIIMDIPVNGSPNDEIMTDTTPTLTWDEVTGASGYEVEINTTNDFTGTVVVTDNTLITNSYNLTNSLSNTENYYWRVRQKDENGAWSSWSETFSLLRNYSVGDIGPSGGYIFYADEDDGIDDIIGVRFLESSPGDISETKKWGRINHLISGADGITIGTGEQNTLDIIAAYGSGANYAANACANHSVENNGTTYDDWFLPSYDELVLMYENLKVNGLGGFQSSYRSYYWSSSENHNNAAWNHNFYNGHYNVTIRSYYYHVRPIRSF